MVPSLSSLERSNHDRHTLFSSRDRIILIVLKTLTILSLTIISILVATGVFPSIAASVAVPVAIFSIWFFGITLLFVINKRELSQFSAFDKKKLIFSQRQKNLIKWGISQNKIFSRISKGSSLTPSSSMVTISVSPYLSRCFPKEGSAKRISTLRENLDKMVILVSSTIEHTKKNFSSFSDCLLQEALFCFGPAISRPNITPELLPCKDAIEKFIISYSLADLLSFCIQNPSSLSLLSTKILEAGSLIHSNLPEDQAQSITIKESVTSICRILNTWFLGRSLEESPLEAIKDHNPSLLSDELQDAIISGNLCKFIITKASENGGDVLSTLFTNQEDLDLLSAKHNTEKLKLDILQLIQKSQKTTDLKALLVEKISVYKNLSSPQSRLFSLSLWKNRHKLFDLKNFVLKNSKKIYENPVIILEILHEDSKLQSFIKEFMDRGLNLERTKRLIRPLIIGVLANKNFAKKDLDLFCKHFNMEEHTLLKAISNGTFLHLIFPNLFQK